MVRILYLFMFLIINYGCKNNEKSQTENYTETVNINNSVKKRDSCFFFLDVKFADSSFLKIYTYENDDIIWFEWGKYSIMKKIRYSDIVEPDYMSLDFKIHYKSDTYIIISSKYNNIILPMTKNRKIFTIKNSIPFCILSYNYADNIVVYINEIVHPDIINVNILNYDNNNILKLGFNWNSQITLPQQIFDTIIFTDNNIYIKYYIDSTFSNYKVKKAKYPSFIEAVKNN